MNASYTANVDVWALGVLIFYLGKKELPFAGDKENTRETLHKNIVKKLKIDSDNYFMNDFPEIYSDSLKDFIKELIIFDPE